MKRFFLYGIPKSLLFKIIIALAIILVGKNVFAQDFNVSSSDVSSPNSSGSGKYTGTEIYNSGTSNVYNLGTRYNGRLSRIVFNLASGGYADPDGFEKGHTYTLSLNMATDDWRNHFGSVSVKCEGSSGTELSNGRVSYISYRKIKFSFTAPTNRYCQFVYVDLKSSNVSSTAFTGVSNWNLSSMVITDPAYCSGSSCGGSSSTPTPTPTPGASNQDIINANNQNTQNIINNQNNNTQNVINNQNNNTNDIIENNNQNTQNIIDSNNSNFNDCFSSFAPNKLIPGHIFSQTGSLIVNLTGYVSSIYKIEPSSTITVSGYNSNTYGNWFILWDENMNFIDYYYTRDRSLIVPTNARFFALSTTHNDISVSINTGFCSSKLDNLNNSINDVNDTIKDDNVDSGVGSDFFNDFSSSDNGGISGIITKPLVLINSLLSNNSSCNNLPLNIQFPGLEAKSVSFPSGCILWNNVPQNVINIYHMFIVGFCSYYLLKRLFKDVEDLKNPEKDNVEVIDL